jgi:hypothetical protein
MNFNEVKIGHTVRVKWDSALTKTRDHCGVTASMRALQGKLIRIHAVLKENIVYAHGLSSGDLNYNWHVDDLEVVYENTTSQLPEKINKSILFDPNNLVL